MGDTGNALLAAIAITAAVYHRDKTGEGQEVSTSIVNAGLLHTSYAWIHADGRPGDWDHIDGDQYGLSPFYRMYQAADGLWVFLAAVSAEERARLGKVVDGLEDVIEQTGRVEELLTIAIGRSDGRGVLCPARRSGCSRRDHRRDILSLDLRRPRGQGIATGDRNLVGQRGPV